MPFLADLKILQLRKRRLFRGVMATGLLLGVGLVLRFVPTVNDALCGHPHYMQAFATTMGRQIAEMLRGDYPVLVRPGDTADCHTVNESSALDSDDGLYLLTFSEESRSICLTVYGILPKGSKGTGLETFTSSTADNYGRGISQTISAVPLHRSLTVLSPQYLALLHWRAKVDPAAFVNAGKSQRVTSPSARISFADASISFSELRIEVARRHNLVNRLLLAWIWLSFGTSLFCLFRLWLSYRTAVQSCRTCTFGLSLKQFCSEDLNAIGKHALEIHYQQRQEGLADIRSENILRREREEISQRLRALLGDTTHGDEHHRIRQILETGELEQMQNLLDELHPHIPQKTPEERLSLLLESLKEYCTKEELSAVETRAFELLQQEGFRYARRSVIQCHDEYRLRAKEAAEAHKRAIEVSSGIKDEPIDH